MKFSEHWLREWVNPEQDHNALAEQITMAGLEVDSVDPVAAPFQGVYVGEVIACEQHPNADKLRVTKVNVEGNGERLLNIVCGASNCRIGLKVAVAVVGASLPGDLKIKSTRLRGEHSEGMLCSFSELGINDQQDGIIELPETAPVGMNLREYLALDDHIFTIGLTPNRGDCLSLRGVAREVALLNALPLRAPEIPHVIETINEGICVHVEMPDACPRYLARVIKGIDINASTPLWMRNKLQRSGIRVINPVVDVTNYILLELGQPMHAFDLEKIKGDIHVRMAKESETLTLLDGTLAKLKDDTLLITDNDHILAMAGIFGGKQAEVNQSTCHLLLECAYFSPEYIAGRAARYGLHTEAAHRYERGVDPAMQYDALSRATSLLLEICGGQAGPVTDSTTQKSLPIRSPIRFRTEKLQRLIGHFIEDDVVIRVLRGIGAEITIIEKGTWEVTPPSWRFDLSIEEDIVEEVVRIYGYQNVPGTSLRVDLVKPTHPGQRDKLHRIKVALAARGYEEAITYSFVDPKIQNALFPEMEALTLPTPISSDMSAMRLSLWSSLLPVLIYSQNRQQSRIRLFESGLRFIPDEQEKLGVRQEQVLAGMLCGDRYEEQWDLPTQPSDFYDIKGDVEAILGLAGHAEVIFRAKHHPSLHPGQSAAIYLDEKSFLEQDPIGFIGALHPKLESTLGLNGRVFVFELLWRKLAQCGLPVVREISRYPANRRDIAVVVSEEVCAEEVLAECKKVGENQLVSVRLFDVYRGKGITEGSKSLAIRLLLQDACRTLEDDEITTILSNCVAALKKRFQATLRD